MYLYAHKKEWSHDFVIEARCIGSVFKSAITLHHIGSTAIEGLYAKDCIDILGVVPDITEVGSSVIGLRDMGYIHKGSYGIEGREYFSKVKRKTHLHIFQEGHVDIEKHLGFVRLMRAEPKLVDELNRLKTRLHKQYPENKDAYQKEKAFFYDELHKRL